MNADFRTFVKVHRYVRLVIATHRYVTWGVAHKLVFGPDAEFRSSNVGRIVKMFERVTPGASAVIVDNRFRCTNKVAFANYSWLIIRGYRVMPRIRRISIGTART